MSLSNDTTDNFIATMMAGTRYPDDPVLQALILSRRSRFAFPSPCEDFLIKHGKPFIVSAPDPKRRRMRAGRCFANALMAAAMGKGDYVQGVAIRDGVHDHAWVTRDGTDVFELTWPRHPEQTYYFGIRVPRDVVFACQQELGHSGIFPSLPEADLPVALQQWAARAAL